MHLLIPIAVAIIVAICARRRCSMTVFYVASVIAAILIGMEVQEGIDK